MRITLRSLSLLLAAATTACNSRNPQLAEGSSSAVTLSGGPNTSMTYLTVTDSGVVAIDLGWWGYRRQMARALERIGATRDDVKHVFITHSHRDHIAAWPDVRGARFHLAAAELPRFLGTAQHA